MNHIPIRYTPRLVLRPFTFADAPRVQDLIGDKQITAPNANIPRLYAEGAAQRWITAYQSAAAEGRQFNFAVTLAGTKTPGRENDFTDTGHLVGAFRIGQLDDSTDNQAVLGFWMGVPYWNNGFATEAGYSILDFAFAHCRYDRIISCRHNDDPGSGRVLQKLGATIITRGLFEQQRTARFLYAGFSSARE